MRVESILLNTHDIEERQFKMGSSFNNGSWNDPVHESFSRLVDECRAAIDEVVGYANDLYSIYQELDRMNIEAISTEANSALDMGRSMV